MAKLKAPSLRGNAKKEAEALMKKYNVSPMEALFALMHKTKYDDSPEGLRIHFNTIQCAMPFVYPKLASTEVINVNPDEEKTPEELKAELKAMLKEIGDEESK